MFIFFAASRLSIAHSSTANNISYVRFVVERSTGTFFFCLAQCCENLIISQSHLHVCTAFDSTMNCPSYRRHSGNSFVSGLSSLRCFVYVTAHAMNTCNGILLDHIWPLSMLAQHYTNSLCAHNTFFHVLCFCLKSDPTRLCCCTPMRCTPHNLSVQRNPTTQSSHDLMQNAMYSCSYDLHVEMHS
jgi:hypothetical protein